MKGSYIHQTRALTESNNQESTLCLIFLKLEQNKRSDVMQIFDLRYPEKKIRYFTIY